MLADLEAKQAQVRDTLLRISGAIQVLEEMLEESSQDPSPEDSIVSPAVLSTEVG